MSQSLQCSSPSDIQLYMTTDTRILKRFNLDPIRDI